VLDDGEMQWVLLSLDLIGIDGEQVAQVRAGVEAQTGIPGAHVMVCCSHTHSGPVMPSSDPRRDPLGEAEVQEIPARVLVLVDALVGAVSQAFEARESVQLRFISGQLEGWSQNRRRVAQGGIPVDLGVRGMLLTGAEGHPKVVVVNYACHPTVMGSKNLIVSAEYPGAMARLVESVYPGCAALFVNGACANLNPNWFKLESNSFTTISRMGQALGGEVIRAVNTALATEIAEHDVTLGADELQEFLPLWEQPGEEEAFALLEKQQNLLERAKAGAFPQNPFPFWHSMSVDENLSVQMAESYVAWAEKLVRLADVQVRVEAPRVEVQALRIGRGGIVSMPGEIFMELGVQIKEAFPNQPVMVAGYTNGSVGYIPTQEAFGKGGYEVTIAQRARLIPIAKDGGETMATWAIRLLRGLFE
ncbi:MAG: hypothetical protein QGG64_10680, partial [Candidatus Latescibacteria bacterium]|jgi:hypothetical protein|nr:hypothetical protein [Candidatus Latescibacterota bacterium]